MVLRWTLAALCLSGRLACLVISPCGYLKEALGLSALVIGLAWMLSSAETSLLPKEFSQHAASVAGPATYSRILSVPHRNSLCIYRNHREILELNEELRNERFYHDIPVGHGLEFHRNGPGWGYFSYRFETGYRWWDSTQGFWEIPHPENLVEPKSISVAARRPVAAILDLSSTIHLWQPNDEGEIRTAVTYGLPDCDFVYISPEGDLAVTRSGLSEIRFWNAGTGVELRQPVKFGDLFTSYAWSADGRFFAFGLENGEIHFCSTHDDVSHQLQVCSAKDFPASLAMSEHGDWLAVGTSTGKICTFHRHVPEWTLQSHAGCVRVLAIDEERNQIISGGTDGRVMIHSLATAGLVKELTQ